MSHSEPARISIRRILSALVALVVVASLVAVLASRSLQPGLSEGLVPAGKTIFDDDVPAVARLDPKLLRALTKAALDAEEDGVVLVVNSGWRSRTYQERLLDEAVSTHGSKRAAARWVAPADASPHVSGDAVDIGPSRAATWLSRHGARYGLCGIYRNEPWHFELRPAAVRRGCPAKYASPANDPRMKS